MIKEMVMVKEMAMRKEMVIVMVMRVVHTVCISGSTSTRMDRRC